MKARGRNQPCLCGSGKKFKKCHGSIHGGAEIRTSGSAHSDPVTTTMSLHDRNMAFLNAAAEIFHIRGDNPWDNIKRRLRGDTVRELYKAIMWIWDAPPHQLIPSPSSRLSALYLGDIDPDQLARRVFQFGLYTDQIFIIDPFQFPTPPNQHPIENPDAYIQDTARLLMFLVRIEPWVRNNHVTLIPNPASYVPGLWELSIARGTERQEKLPPPTDDEIDEFREQAHSDLLKQIAFLPKNQIEKYLARILPNATRDELAETMKKIESIRKDPLAIPSATAAKSQMVISRAGGTSLESALYLCSAADMFPFTYHNIKWLELMSVADTLAPSVKTWSQLTRAFQGLEFSFLNNVDHKFAARLREEERLGGFRVFLSDLWEKVKATAEAGASDSAAREFRDRLNDEYKKTQEEWKQITQEAITSSVALAGIGGAAGSIVKGEIQITTALLLAAMGGLGGIIKGGLDIHSKRRKFRATVPMSIFVDLSKHRPKV